MLQTGKGGVSDLRGDAMTKDWIISAGAPMKGRERSAGWRGTMHSECDDPENRNDYVGSVSHLGNMMDWQTKGLEFPLWVGSSGIFSSC